MKQKLSIGNPENAGGRKMKSRLPSLGPALSALLGTTCENKPARYGAAATAATTTNPAEGIGAKEELLSSPSAHIAGTYAIKRSLLQEIVDRCVGFVRGGQPQRGAENPAKTYNLLWISPSFPVPGEQFRQPVPNQTIENIQSVAERNQNVDVQLWVDSRRMTEAQMGWLKKMTEGGPSYNLSLHNLRTILEYNHHPFYNQSDHSPNWRFDKHSLIWRQVDAARILVCLQSGHEQVFYSDADITNLVVDSDTVQSKLKKHGIILSGGIDKKGGYPWYENQLFGFDARKRGFFRSLYDRTIQDVMRGENGYGTYIDLVNSELKGNEKIDTRDIVFQARYDGTVAQHLRHGEQRQS